MAPPRGSTRWTCPLARCWRAVVTGSDGFSGPWEGEVDMTANNDDLDRRDALKLIAGGLGLAALSGTASCAPTVRASSAQPRLQAGPAPERFFAAPPIDPVRIDRKTTRLNSSHSQISYAVFCLKKKKKHCALLAHDKI